MVGGDYMYMLWLALVWAIHTVVAVIVYTSHFTLSTVLFYAHLSYLTRHNV